jgi:hypothetical protein
LDAKAFLDWGENVSVSLDQNEEEWRRNVQRRAWEQVLRRPSS